MPSQTVIRLPTQGSWDNLTQLQEPQPSAGKHEVLIKVRSVALNFRDIVIATGQYPFPVKENVIPGSDAAGDIVETGEGVSGFKKGDKVVVTFDATTAYGPIKSWAHGFGGPVDGMMREYVSVPASAVVRVPEQSTLTYSQWASVVCTGTTAWNALFGNNPLKPGQTVLLQGESQLHAVHLTLRHLWISTYSTENPKVLEVSPSQALSWLRLLEPKLSSHPLPMRSSSL